MTAKKLLLLGESWTTHMIHQKGFDTFTTTEYAEGAGPLTAALSRRGWEVDHLPAHTIERDFPVDAARLSAYDCVVISDVGVNTFQLTRSVFTEGDRDVDRLGMLRAYVADGGGLAMVGGYLSFAGIDGKARYATSPLADILPVRVLDHDDRRELPDGRIPAPRTEAHPALPEVAGPWPYLLGYNKTVLRDEATLLAEIDGDPLIAVREVGAGRTAVFTSDMSAHWAPAAFTDWSGYGPMWDALLSWTAASPRSGAEAAAPGQAAR